MIRDSHVSLHNFYVFLFYLKKIEKKNVHVLVQQRVSRVIVHILY